MGVQQNIRRLRDLSGVTQQELADIAQVSRSAVSLWEIGETEPRMGAVQLMADYFGILKRNIIEDGGMDNVRVSADGRMYEVKPKQLDLTSDESELLALFRSTDNRGKETILAVARMQQGVERQSPSRAVGT